MMNDKQKNRLDDEVRRTLDLLEQYPRQEASPWFADRVMARLHRSSETGFSTRWQWAVATLLLVANGLALFFGADQTGAPVDDLAQTIGREYGLTAASEEEETYQFTTPTDY